MFLGDYLAPLLSIPKSGAAILLMLPVLIIAFGLYSSVGAWSVRQARFADIGRAQIFRAGIMVGVPIVIGNTGLVQIPGYPLAMGQALGFFAFAGLLLLGFNQRELRILATPSWRKIKYTLNANAGMVRATGLSQIIAAVHARLPILVIASVYGPIEAGFYALAERVTEAPAALLSRAIGDVYRQRAAKMHREGKPFLSLFRNVATLTFALSVAAYLTLYLIIPSHMRLIFGAGWEEAAFTMSMLLISAGVSFWTTALDNTAITVGARGYIVLWQSLRLAIEGGAGLAAILGGLSYKFFLVWLVVGRVLLYIGDIVATHEFSRRGRGF
jgi:O-antigen/teichoic acid export membrane protein